MTDTQEFYLATFYALARIEGYLQEIDIELGKALTLEKSDQRLRPELQDLRDGLLQYKMRVTLLEKTAIDTVEIIPNERESI